MHRVFVNALCLSALPVSFLSLPIERSSSVCISEFLESKKFYSIVPLVANVLHSIRMKEKSNEVYASGVARKPNTAKENL